MKIISSGIGSCMILIMTLSHLNAQSLLKITEITTGGKVFEIQPVFDKKDTTILKKYPNIDINSSIRIGINTGLVKQQANNWISVKADLPVSHMKSISEYLSKRLDLIKAIQFKSENLAEKQKMLQSFSNETAPVFRILLELDQSNPLRIKVNEILSVREKDASVTYNKIFDLLQDEINSTQSEYKSAIEENKVFFRLGTFINNTAVHLEGFDAYQEGDYYFVPPFVTNIPADQKQEFEKYQKLAKEANDDAMKVFSGNLREIVNPILDTLKQALENKFIEPLSSFENAVSRLDTLSNAVKTEIDHNKAEISNFKASVERVISNAKSDVTQPEYVKNLAESIIQVSDDYNTLDQSLKNSITNLEKFGIVPKFRSALTELTVSYTLGGKIVAEHIEAIKEFYNSKNLLQISLTQKIAESLLKLGDEVLKLPLENIPDQATLDLTRTVVRKNGDRLSFKAVLTKASPEKEKQEEKTIDYTSIGLYQIGLHNSIQAVLVLADNLSGEFNSKKQFQFDPSYSVLFKLGSRKSSFYNDFVELGFGVNMATLDFDNDDNPEVGMGLVLSAFKDYLQLGYGRNFGADQNYWFFGIRLPFLGVNTYGKPKTLPADQ